VRQATQPPRHIHVLPGGSEGLAAPEGEPVGRRAAAPLRPPASAVELGQIQEPAAQEGGQLAGPGREPGLDLLRRALPRDPAIGTGGVGVLQAGDGLEHALHATSRG
jgi:hypothetical protein